MLAQLERDVIINHPLMDKHHVSRFTMVDHSPVQEAERVLCESAGLKPILLDENEFFPTCLAVLKKALPSTLD